MKVSPGLLDKDLRLELVEEPLDPKIFNLRVDHQSALGLNYAERHGGGALVGHLNIRKYPQFLVENISSNMVSRI